MAKVIRLTAEQRDDLVAYLDGELEEGPSEQIDRVLSSSPVARHEVEVLARTWEMLDLLERPQASNDFGEKTLATIRLESLPKTPFWEQLWFKKVSTRAIRFGLIAGLAASSTIGTILGQRLLPDQYGPLLNGLPLFQKLDSYEEVGDLEFLREIRKLRLFDEGGGSE